VIFDDIIRRILILLYTIIFAVTPGPHPDDYIQPTDRYAPAPTPILQTPKPTPKPTPKYYKEGHVTGRASWYGTGKNGRYGAAGPELRKRLTATFGFWRGLTVLVCNRSRCIEVKLNDFCRCNTSKEKLIDLSDGAFSYLSPLSRGVIQVTVGW